MHAFFHTRVENLLKEPVNKTVFFYSKRKLFANMQNLEMGPLSVLSKASIDFAP